MRSISKAIRIPAFHFELYFICKLPTIIGSTTNIKFSTRDCHIIVVKRITSSAKKASKKCLGLYFTWTYHWLGYVQRRRRFWWWMICFRFDMLINSYLFDLSCFFMTHDQSTNGSLPQIWIYYNFNVIKLTDSVCQNVLDLFT